MMGSSAMLAHASNVCGALRSWLFQVIVSDRIRCSLAPFHRSNGSLAEARSLCGNDDLYLRVVAVTLARRGHALKLRKSPLGIDVDMGAQTRSVANDPPVD